MVPFVDAVVALTVMYVLLFVLHMCMLRGCEGDVNAGVWGVVVEGMWMGLMVQVLCLVQLVWCVG